MRHVLPITLATVWLVACGSDTNTDFTNTATGNTTETATPANTSPDADASSGSADTSTDNTSTNTTNTTDTAATTDSASRAAPAGLPAGIVMKSIPGGTFTMGNNQLRGPQAGQATEHQVSLSDFELSEAEITNAQYVEFLNAAFARGLIEITTGTVGPDAGKQVITGTASSSYSGKVLYSLEGTRVMKDHDNGDGDGDAFTGTIEPENPLNIAYIGFNSDTRRFYVKDPFNAADFHWMNLCNYFNYTHVRSQLDSTQAQNDFNNWAELSGWTQANPAGASSLHSQAEVSAYPVSFIRWWGAQAFALYYGVKLPTEAQWEYAAKGGSNFSYAVFDGASTLDANWNSLAENPALHHPRAAISGNVNPYGLYNLGGNVWEWMADNYAPYDTAAVTDPLVEVSGSTSRAWRGGSWNYHEATLETAGRFFDEENRGNDHFGFRIAR